MTVAELRERLLDYAQMMVVRVRVRHPDGRQVAVANEISFQTHEETLFVGGPMIDDEELRDIMSGL